MRPLAPDQRAAGRDEIYLESLTVIVPYFEAPNMLAKQVETWEWYSARARAMIDFVVVDDCSPTPPVVPEWIRLYRVLDDIPWNRAMARNLGVHVSETQWVLHVDTDHLLPPESAEKLLDAWVDSESWYRFPRYRVGKADETRKKDAIPDDCELGRVKPHIDSYLCTKKLYWDAGGYDEDYSGVLGGGSPFLKQLAKAGPMEVLPDDICLHVYTRHVVSDASVSTLSRDTTEFKRRWREKGDVKAVNPLRCRWERVQ